MKSYLILFLLSLVLLAGLFTVDQVRKNDGKFHVIFCNVGQGDGIIMRTPSGQDMIFDGGPDQKILGCLSKYLPFWDRDIELMMLSHPHADHMTGLIDVLDRYVVKQLVTEDLANDTSEFSALKKSIESKHIPKHYVASGDKFVLSDGVRVTVLGPTKQYLAETSPTGIINSAEFASLVVHIQYGKFDLLLTGDSQAPEMGAATSDLTGLDVLHVPHHGSRTGLTSEIVEHLRPKVSVISVGKNNYGHPAKETLEKLSKSGTTIFRTDRYGDVEIVSDGKRWEAR